MEILNDMCDMAIEYMKLNDVNNFKKLVDGNNDIVDWYIEEFRITLLGASTLLK